MNNPTKIALERIYNTLVIPKYSKIFKFIKIKKIDFDGEALLIYIDLETTDYFEESCLKEPGSHLMDCEKLGGSIKGFMSRIVFATRYLYFDTFILVLNEDTEWTSNGEQYDDNHNIIEADY
jgi:hypothetical protein